jgi:hypothetical protein
MTGWDVFTGRARAYDYLLGGKDHFAPDRELAERLPGIYPGTRQMARENRRFLVLAETHRRPVAAPQERQSVRLALNRAPAR